MKRPNILLIHCHDLGRHLGCYGVAGVDSPHLDAFAAEGVCADGMFATAPQCSPSRASLFTGRLPHSTGVLGLTHDSFGWDLNPDERHLAGILKGAGYATELVGVHHESRKLSDTEVAARLGFDRVSTGGLADDVAARAAAALNRMAGEGRPFYLQVGFLEPHRIPGDRDANGVMGFLGDHIEADTGEVTVPPYLVDDAGARAEMAEVQGAIRVMDAGVGRVLAELDRLGLAEDTITIFTTDHGLALPRAKCSLYDPGIEVAFLIRWPRGGWSGGRRLPGLLSNVDVVPTLLDALDLQPDPAAPPLQGRSFRAALDGPDPAVRDCVFAEMTYHDYYDPRRAVRTERWKLIANFSSAPGFMDPSQSWTPRSTPRTPSHSHEDYHPNLELYDLDADPHEWRDLAADPAHTATRDRLAQQLATWMTQTGDPLIHGAVTSPLHQQTMEQLSAGDIAPAAAGDWRS